MPKLPRVHAFINALSEAARVVPAPEGIPGGYAGGADGRGYTIEGHWSEDQLDYAIAATAARRLPAVTLSVDGQVKITLYARVDDSEVLNEIGAVMRDARVEPITDEDRLPETAPEAVARIQVDLVTMLRQIATEIEEKRA